MINLIQNNEQWSSTRAKLNEVIATVNVLSGAYTAKPVFESITCKADGSDLNVSISFYNSGNWPLAQLKVEFSVDNFATVKTYEFASDEDIDQGSPIEGSVTLTLSSVSSTKYGKVRAVWAGMVISKVIAAS